MAMEQRLYAQAIMLRREYLNFVATEKNKNKTKFKFQGQSSRSQQWFDLDFDWIELNFSTLEPDFYKNCFQIDYNTQDINTFRFFQVQNGNAKSVELFRFRIDAPILKYCQK